MEQKEAICDVISGAAGIEGGGPARRAGGTTRTADDSGFTPAEIIIGVILLAILATSVVSQALELRQQAQDAAAQTTLRSAVSAARGTYSLTLPGGQNNFVAKNNLTSTASVISGATVNLRSQDGIEAAAVDALSTQEPNINFVTYGSLVPATTTEGGRAENGAVDHDRVGAPIARQCGSDEQRCPDYNIGQSQRADRGLVDYYWR